MRKISFRVEGPPPGKNEALSLFSPTHGQAEAVRRLLVAARDAIGDAAMPLFSGPIGLEVELEAPAGIAWDATNYLGGIADVLQDKTRRGNAVAHLAELGRVCVYANDRSIKEIRYRETPGSALRYRVRVWALEKRP